MKARMHRYIYIVLIIGLGVSQMNAQKKLKKVLLPEDFAKPRVYDPENDPNNDYLNKRRSNGKRSEEYWVVVSDRSENNTYEKPNSTRVKKTLDFGQAFYVIKDEDEWIKLGYSESQQNERKDVLEDYGWIKKENMLLWTRGIRDNNGIHLKAFLINKAKNASANASIKEVKAYSEPEVNPKTMTSIGSLDKFEFYFVYKVNYTEDGNAHSYLLGKESRFNAFNKKFIKNRIVGWVHQNETAEWDTRLALAPNFEEEAYNERKVDSEKLRVKGFGTQKQTIEFLTNPTEGIEIKPIWDNDPVIASKEFLSESDPSRYNTNFIRFPVFKYRNKVFVSGVLQEVDMNAMQGLDIIDEAKSDQIDVFYLIDASSDRTSNYLSSILSSIEHLSKSSAGKTLRIGAGVYRDNTDKNNVFSYVPISRDVVKVKKWLQNNASKWGITPGDNDSYTCVHKGVCESLKKAGFSENSINVLIQIGDQPDISRNTLRSDKNIYQSETEGIKDLMADLGIHWIAADVYFSTSNREISNISKRYVSKQRKQMDQSIKAIIAVGNQADPDGFKGTVFPKFAGGSSIKASNFHFEYAFIKPTESSDLGESNLTDFLNTSIGNILASQEKVDEYIEIAKQEGIRKDPSSGVFPKEALPIIIKAIKRAENNPNLSEKEIMKIISEKIDGRSFYRKVYLPSTYKQYGAKYEPWKFVMFLPEEDLDDYINNLKQLDGVSGMTGDNQRRELQNILRQLVKGLTGRDITSDKNITIDDIANMMNGIDRRGFDFKNKFKLNVKIKDMLSSKKFPDEELNDFTSRITEARLKLERIRKDDNYEFKYTHANTYYWIPIEYML